MKKSPPRPGNVAKILGARSVLAAEQPVSERHSESAVTLVSENAAGRNNESAPASARGESAATHGSASAAPTERSERTTALKSESNEALEIGKAASPVVLPTSFKLSPRVKKKLGSLRVELRSEGVRATEAGIVSALIEAVTLDEVRRLLTRHPEASDGAK